jgi:hypothetical protein
MSVSHCVPWGHGGVKPPGYWYVSLIGEAACHECLYT